MKRTLISTVSSRLKHLILGTAFTIVPYIGFSQSGYYSYDQDNFRNQALFMDTIAVQAPDLTRINAVLFYLTNAERIAQGLAPLTYHPKLEEAAQMHSNAMVHYKFFDHINQFSKPMELPDDRARLAGIYNPHLSENIIESFVLRYTPGQSVYTGAPGVFRLTPDGTPIAPHTYLSLGEQMLHDWMNSPPHRKNILSEKAVSLGCGTTLFLKTDFNDMPSVIATQNFQLLENVQAADQ